MLPIFLFLWLLLELAIYLSLGRWLSNANWSTVWLAAVLMLLTVRANLNAITWVFAAAYPAAGKPTGKKKIGFWKKLSVIIGEYFAYVLTFVLVIPFERLWMPADRLREERRVILLVHGYGCSRGVWWLLRRRLEAAGCTVASLSLFPPFTRIDDMLPQLSERIDTVCAATGAKKLTLLGHSMGGLLCRAYLARHGHAKVAALITLATPHGGSELARFGIGQNARDMEPDSPWLKALTAASPAEPAIPTIAFVNRYDNYVMPPDPQGLPGAYNVDLPPIGHIAMLYDRHVANLLVDACADPRFNG